MTSQIPAKKWRWLFACFYAVFFLFNGCTPSREGHAFPRQPVKIIVYTGPGGMLDITARKFADIASRYSEATFVVENKPGAGGLVALKSVLETPADGYTLFAVTKSLISKIVAAESDMLFDALEWSAMLVTDPECVIVNRESAVSDWASLVNHAQQHHSPQLWLGPAAGGLDHITALKIWDQAGIEARWIPFKSGGLATTALMGQQAVAYVGNMSDAVGKPSLKIAALCASERASLFPKVPTFKELGVEGLEQEFMWRGFAVRKGIPEPARQWYAKLFTKVSADSDWIQFCESGGGQAVYQGPDLFTGIVRKDRRDFSTYLRRIGLLQDPKHHPVASLLDHYQGGLPLLMVLLIATGAYGLSLLRKKALRWDGALIPVLLMLVSVLFALMSLTFPESEGVGSAVQPQLWSLLLIVFSAVLMVRDHSPLRNAQRHTRRAGLFLGAAALYMLGVAMIGYLVSSLLFLVVVPLLLGKTRVVLSLLFAVGWLVIAWIVFQRLMHVPLPAGSLMQAF